MKPRGRPRRNGVKPGWVLHRSLVGLLGYDRARAAGEKYAEGLKAAVAKVRQEFPDMPVSETEMKRVLAEFRHNELDITLLVTESENTVTPEGRKCKKAWNLSIGPRPNYPRHNASDDQPAKKVPNGVLPSKKT